MKKHGLILMLLLTASLLPGAALNLRFGDVVRCDGAYRDHIQGMDTDGENIYWSFASTLVKTDRNGKVLKSIPVDYHCGDPVWAEGALYVPYGGGSWNRELAPGAVSRNDVRVYDAELNLLRVHHVPELVYGAGCIGYKDGHFFVAGGQPDGNRMNRIYEYDGDFRHLRTHTLEADTRLGIQTLKYAFGSWWVGCYGKERNFCIRTDAAFRLQKRYWYATTVGLIGLAERGGAMEFLVAWHIAEPAGKLNRAAAVVLRITPDAVERPPKR